MNTYEPKAACAALPPDARGFDDIVAELMNDADFVSLFDSLPIVPPAASTKPALTEQQLRVLNRKHLLMMLRDLEEELQRVGEEKENLLLAYQAGLRQRRQAL